MNLLEKYQNRLNVSESFYSKHHNGAKLDSQKKLMIAKVLENTNRYMTEAFENSNGTQRADLGDYKKFCLTLNTLALN